MSDGHRRFLLTLLDKPYSHHSLQETYRPNCQRHGIHYPKQTVPLETGEDLLKGNKLSESFDLMMLKWEQFVGIVRAALMYLIFNSGARRLGTIIASVVRL